MRSGIVIFSRMDSRRLPGKALRTISGRALLGHVIDRVKNVTGDHQLIVATSQRSVDDPIAEFAAIEGLDVFRGADDDVLLRATDCAAANELDYLTRISGDSPFVDPRLIEEIVSLAIKTRPDVATNVFPRTFPRGVSIEVISSSALRTACERGHDEGEREHITQYFYRCADEFKIANLEAPEAGFGSVNLAVDNHDDLLRSEWIIRHLTKPLVKTELKEIISVANSWPRDSLQAKVCV